jgi:hypothetical protein
VLLSRLNISLNIESQRRYFLVQVPGKSSKKVKKNTLKNKKGAKVKRFKNDVIKGIQV